MPESKGRIDSGKSGHFGRLTGDVILTRPLLWPQALASSTHG